jgi:transcriptional regulator with XRE-family HTH domain
MSGAMKGTPEQPQFEADFSKRLIYHDASFACTAAPMNPERWLGFGLHRSRDRVASRRRRQPHYARVSSKPVQFVRGMEDTITTVMVKSSTKPRTGRARAQDVDRHVGTRLRERRFVLGLTQQQMAVSIGVSLQQAHKYEKGINRIASGRLYQIAQALGVEVGYFFEGIGSDDAFEATQHQRLLLDLARNFISIPVRKHQEAICSLARALSDPDAGP